MRTKALLNMALALLAVGCSQDPSLQGIFERQQKEDQMDGYNIIHIDERESFGLVVYTSWTDEYPENKDRPGINVYERTADGWQGAPGTNCSATGVARLGLGGNGQLFCSMLIDKPGFVGIRVGETDAAIFEFSEGKRVWYAVVDDRDATVIGVSEDGAETALN